MATLVLAEQDQVRRLLELFPVTSLRLTWPGHKGTKAEICAAVAVEGDFELITAFVVHEFNRCKQHVYTFIPGDGVDIEDAFPNSDPFATDGDASVLHMATVDYLVHIGNPYQAIPISYLWPIRVEKKKKTTVVSFITLERKPVPFSDRPVIAAKREIDERDVVSSILSIGCQTADLNKGIKGLWKDDYVDIVKSKFKRALSTDESTMDDERGIKQYMPDLYEEMLKVPLMNSLLRIHPKLESSLSYFQCDPTSGKIIFTSYTEGLGDSDGIVQAILGKN